MSAQQSFRKMVGHVNPDGPSLFDGPKVEPVPPGEVRQALINQGLLKAATASKIEANGMTPYRGTLSDPVLRIGVIAARPALARSRYRTRRDYDVSEQEGRAQLGVQHA